MTRRNSRFVPRGLGWQPDLPDFRDYHPRTAEVAKLFKRLKKGRSKGTARLSHVDHREYFTSPLDQGATHTSSVHAAADLIEYFVLRAHGKVTEPARLFLYKVARDMLGIRGNVNVSIQAVLKAMTRFGMPPERYWPFDAEKMDVDPGPACYAYANDYRDILYLRLDLRNTSGKKTLGFVKRFLAAGFPVAFGFPVLSSLTREADIPYRPRFDKVRGGQAVLAVGYDDQRLVTMRGALLIRNSWGTEWGDGGYGWLPYAYVEEQLARDFWTLIQRDWLKSGEFNLP